MILQKMKQTAEDYLGYTVEKAVITVPKAEIEVRERAWKRASKRRRRARAAIK